MSWEESNLTFYKRGKSDQELMKDFLVAASGFITAEPVSAYFFENQPEVNSKNWMEFKGRKITLEGKERLKELMGRPDLLLVSLDFERNRGKDWRGERLFFATYPFDPFEPNNPIELRLETRYQQMYFQDHEKKHLAEARREMKYEYSLFTHICNAFEPGYAAILFQESLRSPSEIARTGPSDYLDHFYMSFDFFQSDLKKEMDLILELGGLFEEGERGVFFFTRDLLDYKKKNMSPEARKKFAMQIRSCFRMAGYR